MEFSSNFHHQSRDVDECVQVHTRNEHNILNIVQYSIHTCRLHLGKFIARICKFLANSCKFLDNFLAKSCKFLEQLYNFLDKKL